MLQDHVLEKNGVVILIRPRNNRFGKNNGYESYTFYPEKGSNDSFKVYHSNTGEADYTLERLGILIHNEMMIYLTQGYRDIKLPGYDGITSAIFNTDGSLLSFSNGGSHIAQCKFEDPLKGFDMDVDYIILKDNFDGTILVENKFGEAVICRKEIFRLNLAALGVKLAA